MDHEGQATKLKLTDFRSVPMRTFHLAWFSFFLSFFGWFGIAPLMPVVREEFGLTQQQVANIIIASISMTVFARLAIGVLCDRFGPRRTFSGLLILGSLPIMLIGLSTNYMTFLIFRLAIGCVGASFVITQCHTSIMFAPSVVGTANATTAGWGNLGGGVTQMVMPLVMTAFLSLGVGSFWGWRLAMVVPGLALFVVGLLYYRLTKDTPTGNHAQIKQTRGPSQKKDGLKRFAEVAKDHRVWALFVVYGACFGVELTIYNVAALYYVDEFGLTLASAGLVAGLFGLMNIFARTTGGYLGDRAGRSWGLRGRVWVLGAVLLAEGLTLILFSQMAVLSLAIGSMIVFSLFVQMAEGATFSVVPFINKKALGTVSGIVGAGGSVGAIAAGFLLKIDGVSIQQALLLIGIVVIAVSFLTPLVRFSPEAETEQRQRIKATFAESGGASQTAVA